MLLCNFNFRVNSVVLLLKVVSKLHKHIENLYFVLFVNQLDYKMYIELIYFSERTFVSERNEASGCASASIHSRNLTQDDVSNQSESCLSVGQIGWPLLVRIPQVFKF